MYLTYEEYQEYGGTLDEVTFNDYEFQARARIDWYTFNRLQNETSYPESVKRCVYTLIGFILLSHQAESVGPSTDGSAVQAGITSQSNDGVSVSYNVMNAAQAAETADKKIADTVNQFLQGVKNSLGQKVLYRGIYPNE